MAPATNSIDTPAPSQTVGRESSRHAIELASVSRPDFDWIADFVFRHLGIKLVPSKRHLVASRLLRRLRALQMPNYREYCAYLRTPAGEQAELVHLYDLLTTHKTEFFREPDHFQVLADVVVPRWLQHRKTSMPLSIWSAACSTGEEPYSIAMTLADHGVLSKSSNASFSVLGTDVSSACIQTAQRAIYGQTQVDSVPVPLRKRFLLRSRDQTHPRFRIVPALRARARFRTLNFMDEVWSVDYVDVVFCRNVLIYFQPPMQHRVLSRLCNHLRPGGYLFIGHSETLAGASLPVVPVARSVFQKR